MMSLPVRAPLTLCVFGSALVLAASAGAAPVERDSVDAGTIYLGPVADRDWGRPVASGDLDGDGYDEVIVAASESFGGFISQVHVIRGGPDARFRGAIDLSQGGSDLVIFGASADDNLGSSITTGDVNGDGYDDLLVCASGGTTGAFTRAGIAYLMYGGPDFFDAATRDMSVTADWDVRIVGPVSDGDMGGSLFFGGGDTHAAAIGNLNGDPFGDIALGVHLANGAASGAGRVYVIFGQAFASGTTRFLSTASNFNVVILGKGQLDELGEMVLVGDLTGDGIDELILPNRNYSQALFGTEGAVHIFRGSTTWASSYNLTTPAPITLLGHREYDELGESAAVGDFNGDGIMDLAAAAPGADAGAHTTQRGEGFIYGLLGSTSLQTGNHLIDYATATADFRMIGEFEENLGTIVTAGDYNGDGIDDIAGAQWFSGPNVNGAVVVLFGREFVGNPVYTALVNTDVHILGAPSDRISFSLSSGDVDNDGVSEILFGTPFNNGAFPNNRGTAYVFSLLDGDFDGDGDRDLADYAAFQECFTLAGAPAEQSIPCYVFDMVANEALDLDDYELFSEQLTGPG